MQGSCQLEKSRYHTENIVINFFDFIFWGAWFCGLGKIHQKMAET